MAERPVALILLDTHAWIWSNSEPGQLSPSALRAIESASAVLVSAISPWEIAIKAAKGKLRLRLPIRQWVVSALEAPRVELAPLTPEIAILSAELRDAVGPDPADMLIVATAITLGCPLVTRDRRIQTSGVVRCIW